MREFSLSLERLGRFDPEVEGRRGRRIRLRCSGKNHSTVGELLGSGQVINEMTDNGEVVSVNALDIGVHVFGVLHDVRKSLSSKQNLGLSRLGQLGPKSLENWPRRFYVGDANRNEVLELGLCGKGDGKLVLLSDCRFLEVCLVGLQCLRQKTRGVGVLRVLGGFGAFQRGIVGVSVDNVLACSLSEEYAFAVRYHLHSGILMTNHCLRNAVLRP